MNEKSLEVLKQYDLKIYRSIRGRGGMIVTTDKGDKLLLECVKQEKYYRRENLITQAVKEGGYEYLDTYVKNAEGEIISELSEDDRKYVLKDMYAGGECSVKSVHDILEAVSAMARLHIAMGRAKERITDSSNDFKLAKGDIAAQVKRRTKEMKMAENYLRNKKKKTKYEMGIYRHIGAYYNEALKAEGMLGNRDVCSAIAKSEADNELVHGNFTYHNVFIGNSQVAITNLEKCRADIQIYDLYQFMRKILEKYDWEIELAYRMINEYDRVKTITDEEISVLSLLFVFPEKFWKIVNHYYNMNKAWVSPKSIEKLDACVGANARRLDFLATICAL